MISITMAKNGHALIFVALKCTNFTEVETIFDGMQVKMPPSGVWHICLAFRSTMHAFGHLLQDEWQVFTTPETHLPKISLERVPIFLFLGGAFRVVRVP